MSLRNAFNRAFGNYPKEELAVGVDLSLCDKRDVPRMTSLVNRLAKSKMGKELLETVAQSGYKVHFHEISDAYGYINPDKKTLALNSSFSDAKLLGTFPHEARHVAQRVQIGELQRTDLDIPSHLMLSRAMEADAQACAFYVTEELARKGDDAPKKAFENVSEKIARAGQKALKENNGTLNNDVLNQTFQAWYDQKDVKDSYEDSYLLFPMTADLKKMGQGQVPVFSFKKSISAENIVDMITTTKDGNYFKESPELLKQGKFIDVSQVTKGCMQTFVEAYEKSTGKDISTGIKDIPMRVRATMPLIDSHAMTRAYTSGSAFSAPLGELVTPKKQEPNLSVFKALAAKRAR